MKLNSRIDSLTMSFTAVLLAGLLGIAGCSDDVGSGVTVGGTVTLDGQPLEKGTVFFIGENGSAAAVGNISAGSFSLSQTANATGIEPGSYKVKIESWKIAPGEPQADGSFATGESAIPEKYSDIGSSGFTAEVTDDGGTFEFAMSSK